MSIAPFWNLSENFLYRKYPITRMAISATMLKILNGLLAFISPRIERFA
jgi:hypothetical protein